MTFSARWFYSPTVETCTRMSVWTHISRIRSLVILLIPVPVLFSTRPVRKARWWGWLCLKPPCWHTARLLLRPAITVKVSHAKHSTVFITVFITDLSLTTNWVKKNTTIAPYILPINSDWASWNINDVWKKDCGVYITRSPRLFYSNEQDTVISSVKYIL